MGSEPDKISSAYDVGKLEAHPTASEIGTKYDIDPPWYIYASQRMAITDSATFRRFSDLNMLNLMCLQSELLELRGKFYASFSDVTESQFRDMEKKYINMKFRKDIGLKNLLDDTTKEKDVNGPKQILREIRLKLKEYNSAMQDATQIGSLDTPSRRDLKTADWIMYMSGEPAADAWMEPYRYDLISLKAGSESFVLGLSKLFALLYWLWFSILRVTGGMRKEAANIDRYNIFLGQRPSGTTMPELRRSIAVFNRFVMALFGGVALIGPTIIMTLHSSRNTCLITTSAATFLFAVALAFLASDSSGKDVLAATAAYAAVLVVFVGTSLSRA